MKFHDMEAIAEAIVVTVKGALTPRDSRLDALEQRIASLEAAPKSLDFKGVWQRAADYQRNQAATHKGSLWVALSDSRGIEPGTSPLYWQLAEKGNAR